MELLRNWRIVSSVVHCGRASPSLQGPCFAPKVGQWLVCPSCVPTARHSRFDPQLFRVLLLRRLWLPIPPSDRFCRCGLPLDPRGHHRAACATAAVLGRRGFALESAAARVCREAGARVSLNVRVQDMDLARPDALDNRRLEIVADGLPLFLGAQLAPRCANEDGAALAAARRRKEGPTRSSRVATGGPAWLCWPSRLGDGGPRKRKTSSAVWPGPRPEASHRT